MEWTNGLYKSKIIYIYNEIIFSVFYTYPNHVNSKNFYVYILYIHGNWL